MDDEKIFNDLLEEHPIHEMVRFSELDISEKLQDNALKVIEYKEFYYNELSAYEELERKMEVLKGVRYKYYKFDTVENWQKPEIEKYCLPSDKKINQLKRIMAKQLIRVRFFDTCWRAFDKQGWNMKIFNERDKYGV